jgi:hypothetical protein
MRDRLIIIAGLLFIAACAIFTFNRINSSYSPADYPAPAVYTPAPVSPTASATAAAPASTAARPGRTVTVTVTSAHAPSASGKDGQ